MDDLQLARLEETEALADVDIYLRVAARADDEFALFLRVERVLLGEVCLDGVCLLERGVDEVHFGIALVEVLFHDGIVRAAEDQVFDLFARENVVDLRTDLGVNVVLVEVAAVNECREQGRALADDLALGITLMDELGVLAGGNSELRRDEADALEMLAQDVFGSFFHDADDLVVEAGAQAVGHGGDGVAGDGSAFDAVVTKKAEHIAA